MFVSIDDTELPSLRLLMDQLFPHPQGKNRLACFVWETDGNFDNQAKIKDCHEYVLAYSSRFEDFPAPPVIDLAVKSTSKLHRPQIQNTIVKNGPRNPVSPITLPAGFPASFHEGIILARDVTWPKYDQDVVVRDGRVASPVTASSGWSSKAICEEFIASGFKPVLDSKSQQTTFVVTQTGAIETIKQRSAMQSHVTSLIRNVGSTQSMSEILKDMGITFSFPKPVGLISYLVSMVADKSALVLDSFAGSGTTGHAVLALNKQDGGNRRFILVEIDEKITRDITAERVRRVAQGYKSAKGEAVPGLGGGFQFAKLGQPLFDETGAIRNDVRFPELAEFVFFKETGRPLTKSKRGQRYTPLLGRHNGRAVYLLFNGILGDKSVDGGNVLTGPVLAQLPAHDGPKVIYAAACRMGRAKLSAELITFKQTPYDLHVV
jgi:hypothetical protein